MSAARDEILSAVSSAASAKRAGGGGYARVAEYIRPARTQGGQEELIARFCDMAEFAGARVDRVAERPGVPLAVAAYLSEGELGDHLVLSAEAAVTTLPWSLCPRLLLRTGAARPEDRVSVTASVAGIAETGSVLVRSAASTPNALHFLPEVHIALVDGSAIVGSYEEAFDQLIGANALPRAATFITGPSRTADIEKTPQVGVHGPRQLFIIIIDDPTA